MNKKTRRTRFEARIQIERDFLTPVNIHFGSVAPLAGMTLDAIHSWRHRVSSRHPTRIVEKITKILLEASTRAELLADNSKDVFEPNLRPTPDSMDELRRLLILELNGSEA